MKVKIKSWSAVAVWKWLTNDSECGICRLPFDGCCPDCRLPGDDCPLGMSPKFYKANNFLHKIKPDLDC